MTDTKSRFQKAVRHHLNYSTAKSFERAGRYDWFQAVSLAVREFMIDGMMETEERYQTSILPVHRISDGPDAGKYVTQS